MVCIINEIRILQRATCTSGNQSELNPINRFLLCILKKLTSEGSWNYYGLVIFGHCNLINSLVIHKLSKTGDDSILEASVRGMIG